MPRTPIGSPAYATHRERARERQADMARAGRDIGELPPVADPDRKARCRTDFRLFCDSYFPRTFCLPWSADHLKIVAKIEQVVLRGGQFALAMPRGFGKTSLCEAGAQWAVLYGHRLFVVVVGPDEGLAKQFVDNIRTGLETNDELFADFPEVCYPIRRIEGIKQRRLLYQGEQVRMELTANRIVLPWIAGSAAAGAVIATAGITGQIRGLNHKRPDGESVRPSLVFIDDPQTDDSARSPSQCETRERIINGAILGLAGAGKTIAAIMPCTVVVENDLADRVLNHKLNPQWQGERTRTVYRWPNQSAMWDRYLDLRRDESEPSKTKREEAANAYYLANRAAMDAGAEVAWPECFSPPAVSAIQHAFNIRADRKDPAFFAEYQNEPLPEDAGPGVKLESAELAKRLNNQQRGLCAPDATRLTMFVDVQQRLLYWMVVAWSDNFSGAVIDYGTEPKQEIEYFRASDARRTLAMAAPNAGLEGAIYAGLDRLCSDVLPRQWKCSDGSWLSIDRCLIDANWGMSTAVVYKFARETRHGSLISPSHGKYVGATSTPFSEYRRQPGERVGLNWRIRPGQKRQRAAVFDTNFWKTFIRERLTTAIGDPGALSIFGRDANRHRMLLDHLTAEKSVRVESRGRKVDEWKQSPDRENHYWDCLIGCAVAASIQGCALEVGEKERTHGGRSWVQRTLEKRGIK